MPRDVSTGMQTPLQTNNIRFCFLAMLTFHTQTVYCWNGVGTLVYGGNIYLGVGSFGKIGKITEGSAPEAYGTTLGLSGIDPVILAECLDDIQLGAPAILYFALLDNNGNIYGTPYPLFVGTIDQPSIRASTDTVTITLALENKLANLLRPNQRRWTNADQQVYYPGDTGFAFVESLNDQALVWTL
ncbi:MAG: hypothetical protein ABSF28_07875 [Terracidiphilus sp.]